MTAGTKRALSARAMKRVRASQADEVMGARLYAFMAKREKNEDNRRTLLRMSGDEREHAAVWAALSGETSKGHPLALLWLKLVTVLLGYTFVLKRVAQDERRAIAAYEAMKDELPEAARIQSEEMAHERALIDMLDEERLQYVGAMVLGLNDALVELSGTIAGLTFAMANTRLVALSGIITGAAATLSMAASNYLAERADGNEKALKSSVFTGVAYLVTVALLVLPYLLLPETAYVTALACMLGMVVVIILFFNYYISVAKSVPFARRFVEMLVISLGVAAIAFGIGLAAKALLGIDVG